MQRKDGEVESVQECFPVLKNLKNLYDKSASVVKQLRLLPHNSKLVHDEDDEDDEDDEKDSNLQK